MELPPPPGANGAHHGDPAQNLFSLRLHTFDTPALEAADVLLAKGGGETEKQIYRFQKGDSDLALRFDLTVPLAKYVPCTMASSFPLQALSDRQGLPR